MAVLNCSNTYAYVQTNFLAPVYTVEFILALLGNGFAIWLLGPKGSKNRHAGIIFSLNLAVSDLAYALSLPLLAAYYFMGKNWIFGVALCKVERFLFHCNLYGSIFFITCISVNRCIAVVYPFYARGRVESKHAKLASVAVWLIVAAISCPVFEFSTLKAEKNDKIECLGTAQDSQLNAYLPYSLFLAAFGCGLPFLITLISYLGIARAVWKSHGLESKEKRKVVTMVCVVVVLYSISFLPYHVLRNLNLADRKWPKSCKHSITVHSSFQVTRALVALNPCIHPLLYTSVMDNVRAKLGCVKAEEEVKPPECIRL